MGRWVNPIKRCWKRNDTHRPSQREGWLLHLETSTVYESPASGMKLIPCFSALVSMVFPFASFTCCKRDAADLTEPFM